MRIFYPSKRGSVYYARPAVPLDLVAILGTQTRNASLKTTDEAEAKRRLWPVIAARQRDFDDLWTRRALFGSDGEHALWDHYITVLARDDAERAQMPGEPEIAAAWIELIGRVDRAEIKGIDALSILNATLEPMVAKSAGEISAMARKTKLAELGKHQRVL